MGTSHHMDDLPRRENDTWPTSIHNTKPRRVCLNNPPPHNERYTGVKVHKCTGMEAEKGREELRKDTWIAQMGSYICIYRCDARQISLSNLSPLLKPSSVVSVTMRGETRFTKAERRCPWRRCKRANICCLSEFLLLFFFQLFYCCVCWSQRWCEPMIIPGVGLARPRRASIPIQKTVRFILKTTSQVEGLHVIWSASASSTFCMTVCMCVFSLSDGPGIMRLLSDAAADTQDEDVF